MIKVGIRPLGNESRREDPFRAHFPELKALMLDVGAGSRISATVNGLLSSGGFMNEWDTDMRYAKSGAVTQTMVERWQSAVEQLFAATEF
jgi:hypothetical protein